MKLPDVLEVGLTLVICGTAAGTVSAARREYYAGPGNKFWRMLHETGLTDRLLTPGEFRELPRYGIGLTDLEKNQSGADADIQFSTASQRALRRKIARFAPAILCFSSKRAAKEFLGTSQVAFGLQPQRIEGTLLFVAPSTSGLASRSWDVSVWVELARLTHASSQRAPD